MKYSSLLIFLVIFFLSCNGQTEKSTVELNIVPGDYVFNYPSGEVEVVSLELDSTYTKSIYRSKYDYEYNNRPLYYNAGTWKVDNQGELRFVGWLEYCNNLDPREILSEPKTVNMGDVYWVAPTDNEGAKLSLFPENGYVFVRRVK